MAEHCPYPKKYGDTICVDGTLWELTYSEMGPPDSRQNAGPCPWCSGLKRALGEALANTSSPTPEHQRMTDPLMVPLVGAHFRPPAKQLLEHLPAGCELELRAEPENPYDPKAIQVLVLPGASVPEDQHEALRAKLVGTGYELEELLESPEAIQLGYIADSDGKMCRKEALAGNREIGAMGTEAGGLAELHATLSFDTQGRPAVLVEPRS